MSYDGFIGRVAEVRLMHGAEDQLTKRSYDRLVIWINSFNSRGYGNFKTAVATSVAAVELALRDQLEQELNLLFSTFRDKRNSGLIEFRVNHNEIVQGLCWEGFNIQNGDWIQL